MFKAFRGSTLRCSRAFSYYTVVIRARMIGSLIYFKYFWRKYWPKYEWMYKHYANKLQVMTKNLRILHDSSNESATIR